MKFILTILSIFFFSKISAIRMSKIVHQQNHVKVWAVSSIIPVLWTKLFKKVYQFSDWFLYKSFRHQYYIHSFENIVFTTCTCSGLAHTLFWYLYCSGFIPTENDAQVCLHTRKLLRSTRACKYFQEVNHWKRLHRALLRFIQTIFQLVIQLRILIHTSLSAANIWCPQLRFNLLKDAVKEGLLHFQVQNSLTKCGIFQYLRSLVTTLLMCLQKGSVSTRNLNDHQHRPWLAEEYSSNSNAKKKKKTTSRRIVCTQVE